jgi:putative heme-binding domain-containing protein
MRTTALLGLADGCVRRGDSLLAFVATLPEAAELSGLLTQVFDRSAEVALTVSQPEAGRLLALELLAHAQHETATKACLQIAIGSDTQALRIQGAAALAKHPHDSVAPALLASYPTQTPRVRAAICEALVARPAAASQLLEAVSDGRIVRAELGPAVESRLKQHRDEAVKSLAEKLLTTEVPAERQAVLADYQAALALTPDSRGGKALFRQHCATCHNIGDVGVDVAPDISDSRVKSPAQLLTDILNPNQAIDNNFVSYTVAMADGNVHTGLIAAETASSVTLRQPENKTLTLLRVDIESLRSNGVSLMPEGLEKHLTHQQLADLIGFVKNWRYLEQAIPGTIGAEAGK